MKRRGLLLGWVPAWLLEAQPAGPLSIAPIPRVQVKRGETLEVDVAAELRGGYHTNSHTPSEDYLIPLELTWDAGAPVESLAVVYPEPKLERYAYSDKLLSVYSGEFKIRTRFRAKKEAALGLEQVTGKLRYQACTDKVCLPPRSVAVSFTLDVK